MGAQLAQAGNQARVPLEKDFTAWKIAPGE